MNNFRIKYYKLKSKLRKILFSDMDEEDSTSSFPSTSPSTFPSTSQSNSYSSFSTISNYAPNRIQSARKTIPNDILRVNTISCITLSDSDSSSECIILD
jgi:hypothetical protein